MAITLNIQNGLTSNILDDILLPRPNVVNNYITVLNRASDGFLLDFYKASDENFDDILLVYNLYISYQDNINTLLSTLENGILVSSETDISSLGASGLNEEPNIWASIIVQNPDNRRQLYKSINIGFDIDAPSITVTNITSTSATISYASISEATGYEYELNGESPVDVGSTTNIILNDLTPGGYSVKVRSLWNNGTSMWSNIETFTIS